MLDKWSTIPVVQQRAVFMVAPKCGSTAIKRAVAEKYGVTGNPHTKLARWTPGQIAASGFLKIGISRNPYARAVSCWWEKLHHNRNAGQSFLRNTGLPQGLDFVPFLRAVADMPDDACDIHVRSQHCHMFHDGQYLPDHTFKLEDPGMWAKVQALVDLPDIAAHNVSKAPDWRVMCVGEAAQLIEARWAKDFEVFGYEVLRNS